MLFRSELGCAPSDINALIAAETKKFREAQLEAEAAAAAKNPTTFTVGTKSSD